MRGDILMAQGLAGRKDFRAKEREMEQIILQKRRAEQERPKAPAIKTDTEKELRETTVSKGEEAIRTFETERTRETLQIKLESERLELEEKRKKDILAQRNIDERRRTELKEIAEKETVARKSQEETRGKRLEAIRQREEAVLTAQESKRAREREKIQLTEERLSLDRELQNIDTRKIPLETETSQLSKREKQLQESLDEVLRKEDAVEKEERAIEEREKSAGSTADKKELEKQRWETEEKRRKIEKERWEWEEEIGRVKDKIREISLRYNKLLTSEEEILERQRAIDDRREEIKTEDAREELEREMQRLLEKKGPLEQEINDLLEKETKLQESLDEVLRKEDAVEKEERAIEEREKSAGLSADKKELEKQRWETEEKRRKIEKERWEREEEIGKVKEDLKRVESDYQRILSREKELSLKLNPKKPASERAGTAENQRIFESQIQKPAETKMGTAKPAASTSLQEEIARLRQEAGIDQRFDTPRTNEVGARIQPTISETKPSINQATPPIKPIESGQVSRIQDRQMEVLAEIERLKREAEEERQRQTEAQRQTSGLSPEQQSAPTGITIDQPGAIFGQQGINRKFWIKEEAQDIEKKMQKESEIKKRLDEIQEKEEAERKRFLERIQDGKTTKKAVKTTTETIESAISPEEFVRPLPPRPSAFNKLFSRLLAFILIISIFIAIAFFIYWFFFVKKAATPVAWCETEEKDIPKKEWTREKCVPPPVVIPEIFIPPSLIAIDDNKTYDITTQQDIQIYLSQALKDNIEQGKTIRIIIKDLRNEDPTKREVLTLENFLNAFGVRTIEGFYSQVDKNFTLFIHSQQGGNRLGLIGKLTNTETANVSGLIAALRIGEDTMEQDFQGLFSFLGKTGPALTENFSRIAYGGVNIRCQTFSKEDFGNCYAVHNNYFALTTSLESIKKTLDKAVR